MNNRRKLVIALGASVLAAPLAAFAQAQGKVWRIGFISSTSQRSGQGDVDAIVRGLRQLGYAEGRDFAFEIRWADGNMKLVTGFAAELVRLKVDLIVVRSTIAALAAKSATQSIPVVFTMVSDPVSTGIVNTLARPGGNLTGWTNMFSDTSVKLLELLKAMVPKASRVTVITDPDNSGKALEVTALKKAASGQGLTLQLKGLRSAADVDNAFAQMSRERIDALIVLADGVTSTHSQRIVDLAAKQRLPAIYEIREFVDRGGLMSYGLNINHQYERTAEYIHRIFKGARPADLPVEQPTQFELVINRNTAKTLGLAIPQSLLISADKVIE
jgi:putative ABC transport system substrate-binding protein